MGRTSFFELDDEVPRLVMLFFVVVNSLEVGANVGHSFLTPKGNKKQGNINKLTFYSPFNYLFSKR
jgi:hypothetical protein